MLVNEIYIDFATGEVSGNCSGCNAADVAVALETIVRELRAMDSTPSYIEYDEGKVFAGEILDDPIVPIDPIVPG